MVRAIELLGFFIGFLRLGDGGACASIRGSGDY